MTISVERWLASAVADVRARGLEGAVPVLEAFARGMTTLRAADWSAADPASADAGDGGWSSGSPEAGKRRPIYPSTPREGWQPHWRQTTSTPSTSPWHQSGSVIARCPP